MYVSSASMQKVCVVFLGVLAFSVTRAQDAPFESDRADEEVYELSPIVVNAAPEWEIDTYAIGKVDLIDEQELSRIAQASLGETLAWQPGVSSTYFSPGASRPVIRGFEGYRVRVLQDSIGTLDVSDSSPDHAVALEPLLIREIEIHRGPSALLFGNSAIGGAVNSKSRLIAESHPYETVSGSFESRYDTASEGKSVAGHAEIAVKRFVFNIGGALRDSDDYEIPGSARTDEYDASFPGGVVVNPPTPGDPAVPVENPSGTLPNTFHESQSGAVGVTWLPDNAPLIVGTAYSRYDSEYGIPYQYSGSPADLFGYSSLDVEHERYDFDAKLSLETAWLSRLHLHAGYAEYSHRELFDGRGKDSDKSFEDTRFDQNSFEARMDWYHEPTDWLQGVAGVHVQQIDLEEASFLTAPPSQASRFFRELETDNVGFFLLETISLAEFRSQVGLRYETQEITNDIGGIDDDREESFSGSFNVTWFRENVLGLDSLSITPAVSYVERLPTAVERFGFWPNPAIQRFIIGGDLGFNGEPPLDNEESLGGELGFEARNGPVTGRLNLYYYDYENFVFLQDISGFIGNAAQFVQKEATFYGFEAEVSTWIQLDGGATVTFTGMADHVRGKNDTDDLDLPRIPPWRVGGRVQIEKDVWVVGMDVRHAFEQDKVQEQTGAALPEFETDAYTEVNLDASYTFALKDATLDAFFMLNNLFDEERRLHTSFLKDVAPLPGRSLSIGMRYSF